MATTIGTLLEWYGFILFSTMSALVLNRLFFPPGDPAAATLASFATFAVGFLVRPLGALVIGHYGDRLGRRRMLVITLVTVGLSSALMGALPTYATAGAWAPALLVVLRVIQGFGAGAEYAGASLTLAEFAPPERRGRYAAIPPAGATLGALLSAGVVAAVSTLPPDDFLDWGWRIPFLVTILVTATGFYIRMRVSESPVFEEAKREQGVARAPAVELVRGAPRTLFLGVVSSAGPNVAAYIPVVFALAYLTEQLGVSPTDTLVGALIYFAYSAAATPVAGALGDAVGRRIVLGGAMVCAAAFAFPFFWLLETRGAGYVWFAFGLSGLLLGAQLGAQAGFLADLFTTRTRFSGVALSREIAAALAGGTAPLIATALLQAAGGETWPVALYMALLLISALAVAPMHDRGRREQRWETRARP
ncbi:MFS transporter [Streptomyces sp. S4.7]|uniref:MFS transporter n=1 Tax=Streptomyces sp. S4.7 TaxID=2705439 RepID=UPI0013DA0C47|nr:MFS transporter [Streptomyces sp. S4.7]